MAKKRNRKETPPLGPPKEYAGLWVAWNKKLTRIVASGRSMTEAADNALRAGELNPVMEYVPRLDALSARWAS